MEALKQNCSKLVTKLTSNRKRVYFVIGLLIFLLLVRFLVLRFAPAGYTQLDCLLTPQETAKMEKLLDTWSTIATSQNFTWWVDYGTLLGITRQKTMLPWDKDIDASFMEEDVGKFDKMEPIIEKHGLKKYGWVVVFADDYPRMLNPETAELVVAKLELFPLRKVEDGNMVRPDIVRYLHATTIADKIWWVLLRWTGVAVYREKDIFPLTTATMYHFPMSEDEEERKKHWSRVLPAPHNAPAHLENLYGSTWNRPVKWKVSCYV